MRNCSRSRKGGPVITAACTVDGGFVEAGPGSSRNRSRLFATRRGRQSGRWLPTAGAATAVICAALASAAMASPAYGASGSWLTYVNAQVGRSCGVASTSAQGTGGTSAKETMTLLSKSQTASGTLLHYRIATSAGSAGSDNNVTNTTWEIFANGSVGLPPGFSASSGGYTVTFGGSELYPSPAQLAAGETASRTLTATLGASAGEASTALTELAANGKTLTLQFTIKASVAPTLGSISTPGGTFHSPVGVVLSVVSMKPLTGSALLNHTWALLSSTFSQLFTSTVYFAPGVGPVEIAAPGAHLSLESSGCAG
jgi:hypothetical protein